ncbi:(2Fe-2S)-binding protein [Candidatus Thiodictyon syntrophicum]|jgi:bacterioferritin-associated ferredoxin|uniref:Bacterioferritin-associated ferredoxin n=2 Tax=Thiodictyon TaxID=53392 RepID=A0A2K8U625_9GAMM|nr:(2Fe-2S)-binding protein [Candidatus Thiodictyon syntrophicum]AUB81007.1 hypothetical protein THSYN_08620 [Candidatus Thiodictyon syntrophicum]
MYVCVCNAVTDRQIRAAVRAGASSLNDLREGLGLGGTCGTCLPCAAEVLRAALREDPGTAAGAGQGGTVPAFA